MSTPKEKKSAPESTPERVTQDIAPIQRPGLIKNTGLEEEQDPFALQSNALKVALKAVENMGTKKQRH